MGGEPGWGEIKLMITGHPVAKVKRAEQIVQDHGPAIETGPKDIG